MSYNTYTCGSLEVKPPLSKDEQQKLEQWFGGDERLITDDEVIELMTMEGWTYDTPWSPLDCFTNRQDLYPGVSYIEIVSEGLPPGITAIILYCMLKQIPGHSVNGEISWDGDESEDIGLISLKDGKVYVLNGSIHYEDESPETELYPS